MQDDSDWRPMRRDDVAAVTAISDAVHGDFTEDAAIYAERLAVYPAGCLVLDMGDGIAGYLIAHPWHRTAPPPLNAPLGGIPDDADSYYLHDIALLPVARGTGRARAAIALVFTQARAAGFAEVALMAINGADAFWAAQGFGYVDAPSGYGAGTFPMRITLPA